MKKLVLVLAVVLVLSGIFAVAALTQVSLERDITATVASDVDPNVAVRFEFLGGYGALFDLNDDGYVEFDLSAALSGDGSRYNTEAIFSIGSTVQRVFRITNQTSVPIYVYVVVDEGPAGLVQLRDQNGDIAPVGGWMLATGAAEEFYFRLVTTGAGTGVVLPRDFVARLVISESPQP